MATVAHFQPATAGSERELVGRARRGDSAAFETLYRDHVGRVLAVCRRIVADDDQAEEVTQEAFVRAWRRLGSFRGDSAFGSWLHRLAVNTALDALRARRRRPQAAAGDAGDAESSPAAAVPQPPAGAAVDLERAIRELPPQARTIFVLYDVEGYRHREIARLMGLAEGTSKAQLHRARKLLREALGR